MLPERLLGLVSCVPAGEIQNLVFRGLDPLPGSALRIRSQDALPGLSTRMRSQVSCVFSLSFSLSFFVYHQIVRVSTSSLPSCPPAPWSWYTFFKWLYNIMNWLSLGYSIGYSRGYSMSQATFEVFFFNRLSSRLFNRRFNGLLYRLWIRRFNTQQALQ